VTGLVFQVDLFPNRFRSPFISKTGRFFRTAWAMRSVVFPRGSQGLNVLHRRAFAIKDLRTDQAHTLGQHSDGPKGNRAAKVGEVRSAERLVDGSEDVPHSGPNVGPLVSSIRRGARRISPPFHQLARDRPSSPHHLATVCLHRISAEAEPRS